MIEFKTVDNIEKIAQVAKLAEEIWNQHYLPMIGKEQVSYMLDNFQSEDAIKQQIAQGYQLTVNKRNFDSIAFYQKIGFKIVDCVEMDIGGGFIMDDYVMEIGKLS